MLTPLLFFAVGLIGGMALFFECQIGPASYGQAITGVVIALLGALLTSRQKRVSTLILGVGIAFLCIGDMRQRLEADNVLLTGEVKLIGTVTEVGEKAITLTSRYLSIVSERGGSEKGRWLRTARAQQIRLFSEKSYEMGQQLLCQAVLQRVPRKTVPGGQDLLLNQLGKGIHGRGSVRNCVAIAGEEQLKEPSAIKLKQEINRAILSTNSKKVAAILAALVLGTKGGVAEEVKTLFRRAGIYHLLVVSGLHLSLLGGLIFYVLSSLWTLFPLLLRQWDRRIVAGWGAVVFLAGYLWLVGFQVALMRAFLMAAVLVLALTRGRPRNGIQALVLTAVLLICWEPFLLYSISFQLSVSSTAGILLSLTYYNEKGPLKVFLAKQQTNQATIGWFLLKTATTILLLSTAAFVFTLPPVVWHFHQLSFLGLLTNVCLAPIFTCLILPLGFLGVFTMFLSASLAKIFFLAAGFFLDGVLCPIAWIANLPGSAVVVGEVNMIVMVVWYLFCIGWLSSGLRVGRRGFFAVMLVLALAVGKGYLARPRLRGTVLDVGDGMMAIFEVYPKDGRRQIVVVDTGPAPTCERVFSQYAKYRAVQAIDALFISHFDSDHAGCLPWLAERMPIKEIYSPTNAKEAGVTVRPIRAGGELHFGPLQIKVLHPGQGPLPAASNSRSLTLLLSFAGYRWLLPGDIGWQQEKAVSRSWERLYQQQQAKIRLDLLVAPHHGSRTSSSTEFISTLQPRHVVISGRRLINSDVMLRYQGSGAKLWTTAAHGSILLNIDSKGFLVQGCTCDRNRRPYNGWGPCP